MNEITTLFTSTTEEQQAALDDLTLEIVAKSKARVKHTNPVIRLQYELSIDLLRAIAHQIRNRMARESEVA